MSKSSDGGKGSYPRPFEIDNKTFSDRWKAIEGFGESWLERKKRTEQTSYLIVKEEHDMNMTENSGIPCGCGRSPTGFCTGLHKLTNEQFQLARRLNEQKEMLKEEGSSEENKM